jgi:molybdopterin-guanine dinucleotide biosynthesis protein A
MHNAVIFAGGKSSRMGQDKALLPMNGYRSMAELQYHKLQALFEKVYISSKEEKFDFEAPVIKDTYPQSSPMVALGSVLAQLHDAPLFILSVDMPLIGKQEIEALITHYLQTDPKPDILIAKSPRGLEPLCGIYHPRILPEIKALLATDTHRMRALLNDVDTRTLYFDDSSAFANINTPQEYQAILP